MDIAEGRLIAAAPDLYAALTALATRMEEIVLSDGSTPETYEARRILHRIDGDA